MYQQYIRGDIVKLSRRTIKANKNESNAYKLSKYQLKLVAQGRATAEYILAQKKHR